MAQDWMNRTTWSQQASVFRLQSDTTGYKAYQEDIELPIQRKPVTKDHLPDITLSGTTVDQASNGSIPQSRKIIKSFKLTTSFLGINITITETSRYQQTPVYYAVSSVFNPKQPDIVLYAGEDENGDRLAVAYFRFSRHIRMGFGSEAMSTGNGVWEEMRNTSNYLGHGRYEFEYNVPDDQVGFSWEVGAEAGRSRKRFLWERTRDEIDGVKGMIEQNVGWRNYRLVEQDTGRVLAVILSGKFASCLNKGVLNLHESMPSEMERVVVLTAACICEKGARGGRGH